VTDVLRKLMLDLTLIAAVALPSPSAAQKGQMESMSLAQLLGDLLASETPCNLSYNQAAISAFINQRVRADDLQFNSLLTLMTNGSAFQIKSLTSSGKTAHCTQTVRVARA